LIRGDEQGEELSRTDLLATIGLLLVAGFETTVNLIGNAVLALQANPTVAEWFAAHPDRAPDLVEETLRYDSPVQHTSRFAHESLDLAGTELHPDSMVILLLAGANHDPAKFERPNEFDPLRPNNREHVAFSAGPHFCVGAPLAKLEAAIALRALTERFPELKPAGRPKHRPSRTIRGVLALPVRPIPAAART
jgi:cytochrome P450